MYEQNEKINKEIENIKKCKTEMLELKVVITKLRNLLEVFNSRFDRELKISEIKDI